MNGRRHCGRSHGVGERISIVEIVNAGDGGDGTLACEGLAS